MQKHTLHRSNEPIFWGLFGAGGMWSAFFYPVLILVLCLLLPLGFYPGDSMSYYKIYAYASTFVGRAFLFLSISLPLWCGMHRIHHCLHDMKVYSQAVKVLCYGFAGVLTLVALVGIITL